MRNSSNTVYTNPGVACHGRKINRNYSGVRTVKCGSWQSLFGQAARVSSFLQKVEADLLGAILLVGVELECQGLRQLRGFRRELRKTRTSFRIPPESERDQDPQTRDVRLMYVRAARPLKHGEAALGRNLFSSRSLLAA